VFGRLGVHFFLDEKTNQKNHGCAEMGYLRSDSAKIFETRSVAALLRSDSEDFSRSVSTPVKTPISPRPIQ
jgi:hypothetical protein